MHTTCTNNNNNEIIICLNLEQENKEFDVFLKNLATQDSSPQPPKVIAPTMDEILVVLAPTDEVLVAPAFAPQRVLDPFPVSAPAPKRVYTYVNFVPIPPTCTAQVPAPQRVLASQVPTKSKEETFNSIVFEQVHIPIIYQHHLLLHNTKSNYVMLSGELSRSVRCNKYTHWKK